MSNSYPYIKNFIAETQVENYRIVKAGTNEGQVKHSAASTDALMGVTTDVGASANGRVDVIRSGPAQVTTGTGVPQANIAPGDFLTSDSIGRAIKANPNSGANCIIIGQSFQSASESGCVIDFDCFIGRIQG